MAWTPRYSSALIWRLQPTPCHCLPEEPPASFCRRLGAHNKCLELIHCPGSCPGVSSVATAGWDWTSILHSLFIRDRFPGITSLHLNLNIPWTLRHFALTLASFQRNIQALKLFIDAKFGLQSNEALTASSPLSHEILREIMWPAALQTLKMEVIQPYCE